MSVRGQVETLVRESYRMCDEKTRAISFGTSTALVYVEENVQVVAEGQILGEAELLKMAESLHPRAKNNSVAPSGEAAGTVP